MYKDTYAYKKCLLFFIAILLSSCTGLVQKGGEFLEGSAFGIGEKTLAVYKTLGETKKTETELREIGHINGERFLEIKSASWPGLALRGGMPDGEGVFHLTEARLLSSHINGWNDFTIGLLGDAAFHNEAGAGSAGSGLLRIGDEIERVQVTDGKIKLKDNYLTGNAALTALRNRRERIMAITEWMEEWLRETGENPALESREGFEEYWRGRLFPEIVPRKKRPAGYRTENAEWRRVGGVRWNLTYTEYLLPEDLREYRNSGALLRDWEEALNWIYIEYSWEAIIASFNNTIMEKIK